MAFRSKTRLYVSIALVIGLVVAYSNSQPHGHTHGGNGDHGHAHDDHGHAHNENPAYKYSRAANEPAKQPPQQHHGHSHDDDHHGHHHAHSHGNGGGHHHAHSHGSGGGHHHAHSHGSGEQQQQKRAAESTTTKPAASAQKPGARDRFTIALHAMGSTALISIAPFLILFFIPLNDNNIENQALLKVLLAFASGSLLGDAFLHLIPHSLEPHDHSSHAHSHSHSHQHNHGHDHHDHSQQTNVGLWVMSGILTFLLVEKLIVSVKGDGHSHSHSPQTEKEKIGAAKKNEEKSASDEDDDDSKPKKSSKKETPKKKVEEKKKEEPKHEGIKVAGYLNLAADFAHNFTDGLAIGASFLAGQNLGIITTFTILFHEVPHEIGDFAILIQSGCSKKKAIFLQLVTALGACSGTLLSLLFESAMSGFATSCILPFTAGGFIYIATVTIIPELKESTGFFQSIKEILALVAGVGMMIVISYME